MTCHQEMCQNWTGQGCACEVYDLEPVIFEDDYYEPDDVAPVPPRLVHDEPDDEPARAVDDVPTGDVL